MWIIIVAPFYEKIYKKICYVYSKWMNDEQNEFAILLYDWRIKIDSINVNYAEMGLGNLFSINYDHKLISKCVEILSSSWLYAFCCIGKKILQKQQND